MKLKTLNYIHKLLKNNEKKKREARDAAIKAWHDACNNGATNLTELDAKHNESYFEWDKAYDALKVFEEQDWM